MSGDLVTEIWPLRELVRAFGKARVQTALDRFQCSLDSDVVDFLRSKAIEFEIDGLCRTFCVIDGEELYRSDIKLVAYFTLATTVIEYEEGSSRGNGTWDPAYLIAQLARDEDYEHEVYDGSQLLRAAEELIFEASDLVGGTFIYLDCKPEMKSYYERFGYESFSESDDNIKMYKRIPTGDDLGIHERAY